LTQTDLSDVLLAVFMPLIVCSVIVDEVAG